MRSYTGALKAIQHMTVHTLALLAFLWLLAMAFFLALIIGSAEGHNVDR